MLDKKILLLKKKKKLINNRKKSEKEVDYPPITENTIRKSVIKILTIASFIKSTFGV